MRVSKPALKRATTPEAALIADLVAMATDVPASQIVADGRSGRAATHARQIGMYLAYVILQWPLDRVGAAFGRDRTTAGHACRRIEDRRDDPAFDAGLERLEVCLRAAPGAPGVGDVRLA